MGPFVSANKNGHACIRNRYPITTNHPAIEVIMVVSNGTAAAPKAKGGPPLRVLHLLYVLSLCALVPTQQDHAPQRQFVVHSNHLSSLHNLSAQALCAPNATITYRGTRSAQHVDRCIQKYLQMKSNAFQFIAQGSIPAQFH